MERKGRLVMLLRAAGFWLGATLAGFAVAALPAAAQEIQGVRVLVSGAPTQAVQRIAAMFSKSSGRSAVVDFGTVGAVLERITRGGERPDLVVVPDAALDVLNGSGLLARASRVRLARVGIGVAIRDGAPLPDISTADGVKRTLLKARSIVYPDPVGGGQTGAYVARMIERLGIAAAVQPKTTLLFAIGGGVQSVADGKAEVGLFNVSEILPVKGVKLVGPLPPDMQNYLTFSAALLAPSASNRTALDLLHELTDRSHAGTWRDDGFEPLFDGN
jgi:molybdate transport system substrate-binding protein